MKLYRVYYEQDIFNKHCAVYENSVEEAIEKVKRTTRGEIECYQVDEFNKRLGIFCPVWTDPNFIF